MIVESMKVKALINKEKNRVVFLECYADLVDVLFGFLTMPMATIIKLTRDQPSTKAMIGSMNNLCESVESLDLKHFSAGLCKDMLLRPRSAAESQLRRIRPRLQSDKVYDYFICQTFCGSKVQQLSYYKDAYCHCGTIMDLPKSLCEPALEEKGKGVFVEGLTRYLISDELQIVPLSTAASCSLLSKHGVMNGSDIEQRTFNIGEDEILSLLKSLFVSKTPLTETLLKNRTEQEPNQEYFDQSIAIQQERIMSAPSGDENICVKLIINKTKEAVCYAEAAEDFVNLLFSFLTIPLGNLAKEMHNGLSNGCAHHLYQSVQSLDSTKYLISDEIKQLLLCPKIAPNFGFEKQLLGIQEDVAKKYYNGTHRTGVNDVVVTDKSTLNPHFAQVELKLLDPRSSYTNKETKSSDRYVKGPAMFTITDDLVIIPISALSGLSVLSELNVPFTNIEERIVNVSKEEATRLLVSSLISKSPLTDVFLRQVPKREY